MIKPVHVLLGCAALVGAMSFPLVSTYAQAQIDQQDTQVGQTPQAEPVPTRQRPSQTEFDGRGVAQGSVFTRGRNANVSLTINEGRFVYNMAQPPGTRVRVRYQGSVARQTPGSPAGSSSFTLDGRVQTFDSSASTRIFNNTTGTCRIEVFDARVISSSCRAATADSNTQFLGLEQF